MKTKSSWKYPIDRVITGGHVKLLLCLLILMVMASFVGGSRAQQQNSGGGASNASVGATAATAPSSATLAGGVFNTSPATISSGQMGQIQIDSTGHLIISALPTGSNSVGSISNSAFGVSAGTANIGLVRTLPSACAQTTPFSSSTAQVATGAGTTVTSTTTCVTFIYVNNITNSAVTLRLADKQATPVIWFGGNADFSIPANSNIRIPLDGVTFTSGITAIAGTATALNLQVNGVQ
jgi:hypothetical protein